MQRLAILMRHWRNSPPLQHLGVSLLGGLGLLLVVAVCTVTFGRVEGEEFSPQTFQRRRFRYVEIPLLGIQVTPIDRQDTTNDLERYLRLLPSVVRSPVSKRWDLVRVKRVGQDWEEGDGLILCMYLDALDANGQLHWHTWSQQHPKLATELWPVVQQLAQNQMYVLVPVAFRLATTTPDATNLGSLLKTSLASEYLNLAVASRNIDQHQQALQWVNDGLEIDPENQSLLREQARNLRDTAGAATFPLDARD
ncbi:MAG: hypothetical protein VX346_08060 [Planctomycetota bacterium]|nr:hypothetical protein [Planctomycetota bacterium]